MKKANRNSASEKHLVMFLKTDLFLFSTHTALYKIKLMMSYSIVRNSNVVGSIYVLPVLRGKNKTNNSSTKYFFLLTIFKMILFISLPYY